MIATPNINSEIFRCPNCLGELVEGTCSPCNTRYRQTLGILDLRWPQSGPTDAHEEAFIEKFVERYPVATFAELVALRFQSSNLPEEILATYQQYAANPQARSQQMLDMFEERVNEKFDRNSANVALDLGCGVGASSIALASQFERVVGIDVDLISLILARKFLEEQGVTNVVLVQAYAQNIPLLDDFVDYAIAQNVLEHLFDVQTALQEMQRILTVGGCFCGDSRNRYDLLLSEPHTKLRWVGFWPRRWQGWYVWQFRKMKYEHTKLLSLLELKRFAKIAFGKSAHVIFPMSAAYGRSAKWDKIIRFIERIPLINWLFLLFFPSHLLVAQRESGLS